MKLRTPPSNWKRCDFGGLARSSAIAICRPLLRKASSRRRLDSRSKLNSMSSKICLSGLKRMVVPCRSVSPVTRTGASGTPRA